MRCYIKKSIIRSWWWSRTAFIDSYSILLSGYDCKFFYKLFVVTFVSVLLNLNWIKKFWLSVVWVIVISTSSSSPEPKRSTSSSSSSLAAGAVVGLPPAVSGLAPAAQAFRSAGVYDAIWLNQRNAWARLAAGALPTCSKTWTSAWDGVYLWIQM